METLNIKSFSKDLEKEEKYLNQVIDLILDIQKNEFKIPIELKDQEDLLEINNFYRKPGGEFIIACINEEIIGTIALIKRKNIGILKKMFVKKEFRGKEMGIAQKLMDKVINYCQENEFRSIYLGTIDKYKAAHRFYEKNGFIRIDKTLLPKEFPIMEVDNTFYRLNIINF